MFLAIDIGNSNCTYAVHTGDAWTTPVARSTTAAIHLSSVCEELQIAAAAITSVGISSVVPLVDQPMRSAVKDLTGLTPTFVSVANCGIPIVYPLPEEIGADRLADAVGTLTQYTPPLIIIDFGTATTFDYINHERAYCGGPIMPGVLLAKNALTEKAAKLPSIDFAPTHRLMPQTTVEAMQAGIFYGTVGSIDYLIDKITEEVGGHPTLIATGGLASTVVPALRHHCAIEPMLVFEGIRNICMTM